MKETRLIAVDLANVYDKKESEGRKLLRTLAWGDRVDVLATTATHVEVEMPFYSSKADGTLEWTMRKGFIVPGKSKKVKPAQVTTAMNASGVLKVDIVDVQQGDGAVIETPDGKVVLVDGGDNQLFARYLASRFRNTTAQKPQVIDLMLVTHGDADHFEGLTEIPASEKNKKEEKRLFIKPVRVYHNGLVKRPGSKDGRTRKDEEMFGATKKVGAKTYVTELVDDLLDVPAEEMNVPFKAWKKMLADYKQRYQEPITMKRLEFGDDKAFDFMKASGVKVNVLGPLTTKVGGKPALQFLGTPPDGPRIGHESLDLQPMDNKTLSASHTINGHSIVFRITFGGFSFLFCGDLNDESSRILAKHHAAKLRSTVFKVPHHGSADFSGGFIKQVEPVVSLISSGDENPAKEYIHPRATLMGALGRFSRVDEPLIFCTELVAFFKTEGYARLSDDKKHKTRGEFFGFSRAAFGMVKMRTDGQRLLVYTNSGNVKMKEAYAYTLDNNGEPVPAAVVKI